MTEIPQPGQIWKHRNGVLYTVLFLTNTAHISARHPPDVVYTRIERTDPTNYWSRPATDWHRSFTKCVTA